MRLPLLLFHIAGGMIGLVSGCAAMVFRKGSRGHRLSGNVFVVSMLIMGTCGSTLAVMKGQMNNVFGGLLTVYMITTAWLTGHRRDGQTSVFDWGAMVFGLAIATSLLAIGVLVAGGKVAGQAGVPVGMYFFMGMVPGAAVAGDLRMLVRGGVSGTPRIARHLWRMCFGLFIATGSFFLGQQQVIPAVLRRQFLLFPLAILPLVLLIYWLVRLRIKRGDRSLLLAREAGFERAA